MLPETGGGTTDANTIADKVYDYADDPTKAIATVTCINRSKQLRQHIEFKWGICVA